MTCNSGLGFLCGVLRPTAASLLVMGCLATPAAGDDVIIERGPFPVAIGAHTFRLDGLIAKPAAATNEKLPLALLVPGDPEASRGNLNPMLYAPIARDIARRGWLTAVVMRRGYGASEGPKPLPLQCKDAAFAQRLATDADDLSATLAFLSRRADADPSRAIALGVSDGGAAVVALSAVAPLGLKAVVSISGGLRAEGGCRWQPNLVNAYRDFGKLSRIPNLWMYAANDRMFDPDTAEQLHAAFLDGGGDVTFMAFDAVGNDGHTLFSDGDGRHEWLREMDAFLRARSLPTWTRAQIDDVMKKLDYPPDILYSNALRIITDYFAEQGEKALAHSNAAAFIGAAPALWWNGGKPSLEAARTAALAQCSKSAAQCVIVMENFAWVGGGR